MKQTLFLALLLGSFALRAGAQETEDRDRLLQAIRAAKTRDEALALYQRLEALDAREWESAEKKGKGPEGSPGADTAPGNPAAPPAPEEGKNCPRCGRPLPDWSDSFGRTFCENPSCTYGKADPDHGTCSNCGARLQWSNGRTFCPECHAGVPDNPPGENGEHGTIGTAEPEKTPAPQWEYHDEGRDRADMRVNNPDGGYTLYQVWGGTAWDPSWDWKVWTYDADGNIVSSQTGGAWGDKHRPEFPSKPW